MSDPDDSVIEQLQAKRSRPRRQPPARRTPQAAPAPPPIAINVRQLDQHAPDFEPTETPPPPADADHPAVAARAGSSATPAVFASGEKAEDGHGTPSPLVLDGSTPAERDETGSLRLEADEPTANYAVRVRRSLDDLVAWRLAELRRHRVRASKVELTEMLLWELGDADIHDILARLANFREHAPRQ